MNGASDEKRLKEDQLIDLALRVGGLPEPAAFIRPSADIIEACVLGTASDTEREFMRTALESSASFRREILLLVRGMQLLTEAGDISTYEHRGIRVAPPVHEFLRSMSRDRHITPTRDRRWMAIAAALVLLFSAYAVYNMRSSRSPQLPEIGTEWLQTELLTAQDILEPIADGVAGAGTISVSGRAAALAEFARIVTVENGAIQFKAEPAMPASFTSDLLIVTHHTEDGSRYLRFDTSTATTEVEQVQRLEIWALSLPSGKVYTIRVRGIPAFARSPTAEGENTCYLLLGRTDQGFKVVARSQPLLALK